METDSEVDDIEYDEEEDPHEDMGFLVNFLSTQDIEDIPVDRLRKIACNFEPRVLFKDARDKILEKLCIFK